VTGAHDGRFTLGVRRTAADRHEHDIDAAERDFTASERETLRDALALLERIADS
jgi:hypothetical protein